MDGMDYPAIAKIKPKSIVSGEIDLLLELSLISRALRQRAKVAMQIFFCN